MTSINEKQKIFKKKYGLDHKKSETIEKKDSKRILKQYHKLPKKQKKNISIKKIEHDDNSIDTYLNKISNDSSYIDSILSDVPLPDKPLYEAILTYKKRFDYTQSNIDTVLQGISDKVQDNNIKVLFKQGTNKLKIYNSDIFDRSKGSVYFLYINLNNRDEITVNILIVDYKRDLLEKYGKENSYGIEFYIEEIETSSPTPPVDSESTPTTPPVNTEPTPTPPPVDSESTPTTPPVDSESTPTTPPVDSEPTPPPPPADSEHTSTEQSLEDSLQKESIITDATKKISEVISGSKDVKSILKTYTYNPDDIDQKLSKIKIIKKNNNQEKDGVFLIGNKYGHRNEYRNIYEEIRGTTKYKLSGRYKESSDDDNNGTILWFDIVR
jgi:hypothetical protein